VLLSWVVRCRCCGLEKQGGQVQEKLGELDNFLELAVVSTWVGELESWVAECLHVGEVG